MANPVVPLQDLAQRISQQQAELLKLRREYAARQVRLDKLAQRKVQLQAQLKQVEAEIAGISPDKLPVSKPPAIPVKPTAPKPVAAKPTASKPAAKPGERVSLPKLLVQIVVQAKRPVTIKELAKEVVRRKYPSTSNSLPSIVETRVHELVKKGLLRRAPNQAGILPAGAQGATATPTAPKNVAPAPMAKPPVAAVSGLTLPEAVTKALTQSTKPLTARELAEKVLAGGYQSKSKDFINVIWAGVSKMDNIENVPGQGYRLKRRK